MISQWILLKMRNMSDKNSRENQNRDFIFSRSGGAAAPRPQAESPRRLWKSVEKYGRAIQATDDMTRRIFGLDNWGYKHTLRICNIYCFSMETMVTWTPQYYAMQTFPVLLHLQMGSDGNIRNHSRVSLRQGIRTASCLTPHPKTAFLAYQKFRPTSYRCGIEHRETMP
jgi:hypothetical protein